MRSLNILRRAAALGCTTRGLQAWAEALQALCLALYLFLSARSCLTKKINWTFMTFLNNPFVKIKESQFTFLGCRLSEIESVKVGKIPEPQGKYRKLIQKSIWLQNNSTKNRLICYVCLFSSTIVKEHIASVWNTCYNCNSLVTSIHCLGNNGKSFIDI